MHRTERNEISYLTGPHKIDTGVSAELEPPTLFSKVIYSYIRVNVYLIGNKDVKQLYIKYSHRGHLIP